MVKKLTNIRNFSKTENIDYSLLLALVKYFDPPVESNMGNHNLYQYDTLKQICLLMEEAKQKHIRALQAPQEKDTLVLLCESLVNEGMRMLNAPKKPRQFTQKVPADELLNDLENFPHAFVIGCLMDRQIKAQLAWKIPYQLKQRLGSFDFQTLYSLCHKEPDSIYELVIKPTKLHRYSDTMTKNLISAIKIIADEYEGDASKIWSDNPSSEMLVKRFRKFPGIGPKISTMAANILVRDFGIEVSDRSSIDISVDVHVERVFPRMGFVPAKCSKEDIISKARELNPEYPGVFDKPIWNCGRLYCKTTPECVNCGYSELCAKNFE